VTKAIHVDDRLWDEVCIKRNKALVCYGRFIYGDMFDRPSPLISRFAFVWLQRDWLPAGRLSFLPAALPTWIQYT
jgi:hypothetical protein